MEYIGNYIVAGLLVVVALVALVQTALSRRDNRRTRQQLSTRPSDDDPEQSYQEDVKDQQKRPR